jgi:hypothetical protein
MFASTATASMVRQALLMLLQQLLLLLLLGDEW